ncbi:hypothetical protein ACFFX1_12115 [Dactylosporangium sucinum]|uniref:Uncharacterized protein n=1 Tax=Dactylosporangium sucinum TaxID=1424081 RepID=A0A917WT89_9ACTN|nr:hypothetical protein [Dactylosporangium sucinum]GGM27338.1 hypothetical protein GCM10007977_030660 [Dactylosporangium sucinum]
MPTRLLLEGRDLEELLAQVRAEHGPDAVIVSAEKVRTGGLFGAHKFELTVEVPDGASAGTTESPPGTGGQADTPKRLSIEDLAAIADAAELPRSSGEQPRSFAEALAAERAPTAADALHRLLAEGAPADAPASPSVRPIRAGAGQPVARLGTPAAFVPPTFERPEERPARPPASRPDQHTTSGQESHMPVEATATVEKPRTPPASERLAAAYREPPEPAAAPVAERASANALSRKLQSLGVPADIAMHASGGDTYSAIVEAFTALPDAEPAPDAPGETLVVVGESTHAMEVARWVAEAQRLDDDHILFAGRNAAAAGIEPKRRITGAHDARLWAKKLRKSDAASVVAVEAALDEAHWAAAIVEAVRPVAVWVVVDASRKTSDVAHHLQGLRRVDAICLRGTGSSGDPASPLSLRLPVALLDGRPSTPYQWAAMLCERLSLVSA